MSKKRRNIPILFWAALTSSIVVSAPAFAQDVGWNTNYDKTCSRVESSLAKNMRQITDRDTGRVSIAHRGAYSQPLPGTAQYPAENTILAFQYAQCQGFTAVEVDLKITNDGVLILAHDVNLMRFTNYDFNNGQFDPAIGAQIRTPSGITREYAGNAASTIESLSWPDIVANLHTSKTYDASGAMMQSYPVASPNSIKLETVLIKAKTDPTLSKIVWVLDIQTNDQLNKVLKIISDNNLWDRIIFKVWTEAVPMYDELSGFYRIYIDPIYRKGHWVFSVNPVNTDLVGEELKTKYYDIEDKKVEVGRTYGIIGAIGTFSDGAEINEYDFNGVELFVTGSNSEEDKRIADLQKSIDTFSNPGRKWGVIRIADYTRKNCNTPSPAGNCTQFPDGEYYGNAQIVESDSSKSFVRLYSIPAQDSVVRRNFGEDRQVETEDIRWPSSRRRFINSPQQRTTFISSIQSMFY
ncbi:hypothetical protein KRZ98_17700 [Sphingobium sp. AS12]|uniref:glycerophosphodiester phosphodiesterase family protein n=1 Tax=Sphingobium sp. AS12 TaxID=2849495 RepID=UPI001C31C11C|nr:glycerophosphodiester phosphodiesterase family protein [Sphingobium sp. AS12]MBV2150080.1 hypothetical protein [Sphingobium sp. AS12]